MILHPALRKNLRNLPADELAAKINVALGHTVALQAGFLEAAQRSLTQHSYPENIKTMATMLMKSREVQGIHSSLSLAAEQVQVEIENPIFATDHRNESLLDIDASGVGILFE